MKRLTTTMLVAIVLALLVATPASAVSMITNTFTLSDQTVNTSQKIVGKATTVFDTIYIPNPYPSSFHTEMNAYHFGRPVNTGHSLVAPVWVYKSTGRFTSPCYQFDSGTIWLSGLFKVTAWADFAVVANSAPKDTVRGHRHGQYQGRGESQGASVWRYTTHN